MPDVRMKTLVWVGAVALLAVAVYFVLRPEPPPLNYPPHAGPVAMVGDSLVAGTGASEGKSLPELLAAKIGEPVENFGVPGDTAAKTLERLDQVIARHPRIALVLVGGNDYLRRVPREETFAGIAAIIDALQEDGAVVVLLGVRGGLLADNFAGPFESLAKVKRAVYVPDVLDGLLGNKHYMYDEIHPNDAGYALIAERVSQALKPVLQ